jgi:hypothetical protein
MKEWRGAWVVSSQVRVVWAIPGNPHVPPTFPTSSLPQIPLERQYSKKFFCEVAEGEWSIFSICFKLTRAADPTYKGKLSPISFPWGSFGCKVSELFFQHCQGSSWKSGLLMEISLICRDRSPVVS